MNPSIEPNCDDGDRNNDLYDRDQPSYGWCRAVQIIEEKV